MEVRRRGGLSSSLTAIPRMESVRRGARRASAKRDALPGLHDACSPRTMRRLYPLPWPPNLIEKILFGSPRDGCRNPNRKLRQRGMAEPFRGEEKWVVISGVGR